MAYPNTYQSHSAAAFVDEDSAVLDPAILDPENMHSPNGPSFRKDSFANSHGVLSPADSQAPWDHQYHGALAVEPTTAGAANQIFRDDGTVCVRQPQHHPQNGFPPQHQAGPWGYEQGSGNCTPTTGAEFMPPPPPFDNGAHYVHARTDSAHGSFSHPPPPHFNAQHVEAQFIPAPQVQTPMSPHSHQDWMGMAQQEMEGRPTSKRMRPSSPPRTLVDFQRRDGIRKKNGRIDIPHERNIQTIDELIEQTTDEDTLKELKQQKRLLRNREAALASRQRKKKHTEDLEVKEKSYTTQISMLESQLGDLTREREARERERQVMHQRLAESQRLIDAMQEEKRDMMMRNNEETALLRRRVQLLTEQLEAGPAPAMSAAPSSTGFTDFNAEMEALNMGPHDWDNFMINDFQNNSPDSFSFDSKPEPKTQASERNTMPSLAVQASNKKSVESVTDQPIASGLLFMLLLCGAWIAAKPTSSQPHDMPQMPPDVRAAAPTILNSLLSEGASLTGQDYPQAALEHTAEPMPSGLKRPSRVDRMHHAITAPTKQQQVDQAFALTQAQYASITNGNGHQPPNPGAAPPQRRVLAEALANFEHNQARNNKAEVYTRSLLWSQIPVDVVRQFKELVREHNELDAKQQQTQ